jgi:hypothetical protein
MVLGGHSSPRAALIQQAATAKRLEQVAGRIDDIEAGGIEPPYGALQALYSSPLTWSSIGISRPEDAEMTQELRHPPSASLAALARSSRPRRPGGSRRPGGEAETLLLHRREPTHDPDSAVVALGRLEERLDGTAPTEGPGLPNRAT